MTIKRAGGIIFGAAAGAILAGCSSNGAAESTAAPPPPPRACASVSTAIPDGTVAVAVSTDCKARDGSALTVTLDYRAPGWTNNRQKNATVVRADGIQSYTGPVGEVLTVDNLTCTEDGDLKELRCTDGFDTDSSETAAS